MSIGDPFYKLRKSQLRIRLIKKYSSFMFIKKININLNLEKINIKIKELNTLYQQLLNNNIIQSSDTKKLFLKLDVYYKLQILYFKGSE